MTKLGNFSKAAALAGAALIMAPATTSASTFNAVNINSGDVGKFFNVNFNSSFTGDDFLDGTGDPDETMSSKWTITGFNGTTWNFDIFLDNTSSGTLTRLGFATDPDLENAELLDADDNQWVEVTPIGGNMRTVDVCFGADSGGSCQGGNPTDGLQSGQQANFSLAFDLGEKFVISDFRSRFQETDGNEGSAVAPGLSETVTPVPLPAAGWLLLTAMGGLGYAGYRRRRAAA